MWQNELVTGVLALMGCSGRVEVALASPRLPAPSVVALASVQPRASVLLKAAHEVLRAAEMVVDNLTLVVAATGPGSFTGIRNTLACALGLAQASHLSVHGFSSLLVQAARADEPEVLAVQNARRGWVYAQPYKRGVFWVAEGPVRLLPMEELSRQPRPVVAPPGMALPPRVRPARICKIPAEALLDLALHLEKPDPSTLVPTYVEAFPTAGLG